MMGSFIRLDDHRSAPDHVQRFHRATSPMSPKNVMLVVARFSSFAQYGWPDPANKYSEEWRVLMFEEALKELDEEQTLLFYTLCSAAGLSI